MREREIEKIFRKNIQDLNGICYKFVSPGNSGVPDRIVILKNGEVIFVELKTEKGVLSALQKSQIRKLKNHNQRVCVAYGLNGIQNLIDKIKRSRLDLIKDEER